MVYMMIENVMDGLERWATIEEEVDVVTPHTSHLLLASSLHLDALVYVLCTNPAQPTSS
jgi:hypothetical protein